jgi:predicted hydrolase (HD superfamily)
MKTRNEAEKLMKEHVSSDSLRKHMYAVEAIMRFYASKFGEDEDLFDITGLLHDMDYEKFPDKHPQVAISLLSDLGYDNRIMQAIDFHAKHNPKEFPTLLDKTLWASDEISGFVTAVTLVRPNKRINEVEVSSVKKKMKDKAFAKSISRDDLLLGAEVLGLTLDDHIANVISAMQGISDNLGL